MWTHSDTTSDQDSEKSRNQHKGPGQGAGWTASRSEGKALRLKEESDVRRLRWVASGTGAGDWEALSSSCRALHFPSFVPSLVLNYVYACVQVCVCELVSLPLPLWGQEWRLSNLPKSFLQLALGGASSTNTCQMSKQVKVHSRPCSVHFTSWRNSCLGSRSSIPSELDPWSEMPGFYEKHASVGLGPTCFLAWVLDALFLGTHPQKWLLLSTSFACPFVTLLHLQ